MATVIERDRTADDRGIGAAGIIAIIVVVLLAALLLFRGLGARTTGSSANTGGTTGDTSAGASVGGSY